MKVAEMKASEIKNALTDSRLNVLVNAYAVSPSWGSEPGMGWNWVTNIARYCNVHVITEGEWRDEIEAALKTLPQRDNLHFHYLPVTEEVRRMCWNQGDWRFYLHYRRWQKRALEKAREIVASEKIDILHQLNMIGFREPGYLWKISGLPLVWGPIGGLAIIPQSFLKGTGVKLRLFFTIKNLISRLQFRFQPRVRKAVKGSYPISAMGEVQETLRRIYGIDSPLINETGTDTAAAADTGLGTGLGPGAHQFSTDGRLRILWVGKLDFRKRLDIALRSLAKASDNRLRLSVCGAGRPEQTALYRNMAEELGIGGQVKFLGKVPHEEMKRMMTEADLLFFTSISEATSTVVLEAISAGLPVLSFDANGFGPLVSGFAGIAVALSSPEKAEKEFAEILCSLASAPDRLRSISAAERIHAPELTWDSKARRVAALYHRLCGSGHADLGQESGETAGKDSRAHTQ